MGKKRTISSKSIGSRSSGKSFFASKKTKAFLAAAVILIASSFILAVTNQVDTVNTGMDSDNLKRQIEEQRAERRRLVALKAEAMSPEHISRAAAKLGFIPMSARNIKGYEATDGSVLPKPERASLEGNPTVKTLSSGVLGGEMKNPELVLVSDRSQKRER